MNWRDHVQARLRETQPASVCALDESARLLLGEILPATPIRMHDDRQTAPPDTLAFGIDALNGLSAQQARHLISQIRLYRAPRILFAMPSDCALDEEGFRALGFMLLSPGATDHVRVFYYDIEHYKTVPDWLNSRYWAHPGRWEAS